MDLVVPLTDRVRRLQALSEAARSPSEPGTSSDVPAAVREAAVDALHRGETHYAARPRILPLRERVATQLQATFGIDVDAKSGVVITCGGTEARFVAVQQLLQPGSTIVALARPQAVEGACVVRGVDLLSATTVPGDVPSGSVALFLDGSVASDVRTAWLRIFVN